MFSYLFRMVLFFVVISVIRSLIQSVMRAFRGTSGSQSNPAPPKTTGEASSASTLLHQDPVCGTYVAPGSSFKKVSKGQVFHFCSEACRDRYVA